MTRDPDLLIRSALTPGPEVFAPAGLANAILDLVETTPQRRGLAFRLLPRSTGLRLVLALVVLGLAIAGSLLIVGANRHSLPRGILGYHGPPQRTGVMPGPGPVGTPGLLWNRQLTGPISQTTTPLVSDGSVYVAVDRGNVAVLDERTGVIRSSIVAPGGALSGSLAIADGRLIDGSDRGLVATWDVHSLAPGWTWTSGTGLGLTMAATDEVLVAGSLDGHVYGLDPATGARRWAAFDAGGPVGRSAALDGAVGIVGADTGRITSFDVSTGVVRWTASVGGTEVATPTIANGVAYVASGVRGGSKPYVLTALDLATGAVKWRWSPPTTNRMFVGAVDGSSVYVVSEDRIVYRVDAATGAGGPFFRTGGPIGALPSIVGSVLYVASGDRTVTAVDRATGSELWKLAVPGAPSGPAVVDGLVVVGTDVGRIVAIGASTAPTGLP